MRRQLTQLRILNNDKFKIDLICKGIVACVNCVTNHTANAVLKRTREMNKDTMQTITLNLSLQVRSFETNDFHVKKIAVINSVQVHSGMFNSCPYMSQAVLE